ncbi:exopolysaccharide biosynthesis protein VpsH [Nocardioides lentus]|uniref:Exopolysaccharide biosynthesis protein VpsH n=1 Tax=Nocardioides lentus TaxID=338077 RepID=A0ABP5AQN5_9ACTN
MPSSAPLSLQHRLRTAHPLAPGMRRTLARLDRASTDEVRAFQERRLRALVRWAAARSPYHRAWFAEHDVSPADVRTLADLPRLPLLRRADLVEGAERFLAYPRRLVWPSRSSGTSGSVVTVYRTPGSSAYELAALQRQWGWFGVPPGARRLAIRAAGADASQVAAGGPVTREVPGARQLLLSGYDVARADPARLLAEVRAFAPDAVEGWPSAITALATLLLERGETLPVRAVITSSEVMTAAQRELMGAAYAAPVVDHYGQTERVTLAGTCEAGGYHLFDDYAITELLPVPGERERWEIVGTPLHNWGFPLLRYATGDLVGPAPAGPCPCGRGFARLGAVAGRAEDAFTSADGRPLPLPGTVVDAVRGLREVQIAQLAPGRFEVRMVPGAGAGDDVLAAARADVLAAVERYFGPGQQVGFAVLDRIPRSASGKLRPAVVERAP